MEIKNVHESFDSASPSLLIVKLSKNMVLSWTEAPPSSPPRQLFFLSTPTGLYTL